MFFNKLLPYEIPVMETFIKYKVHQIVSIIFKEYNGYIPRVEAPYLIRYFLQFPSQSQVVDEILVEIGKLESSNDKSKELIEVDAFEKYLITILKSNKYAGYDKETLIEAFRILDNEKNGYLDLHTYYTYLKRYGITFTKEQLEEMESFLLKNDNELLEPLGVQNDEVIKHKPTTTRKFYYESYVRKVLDDNQKHFEDLMKEYRAFFNEYEETKKFPDMPVIVNNNLPAVKEEAKGGQAQAQPQAASPPSNQPSEQKQGEKPAEGEKKEEAKKENEKKEEPKKEEEKKDK
jgi:Ca2+-binding EF-hand superfamily protein